MGPISRVISKATRGFQKWKEIILDDPDLEDPPITARRAPNPFPEETKRDVKWTLSDAAQDYINRVIELNGPDAVPMFTVNVYADQSTGVVRIEPITTKAGNLCAIFNRNGRGSLVERDDLVAPSREGLKITPIPAEVKQAMIDNARSVMPLQRGQRETFLFYSPIANMDP